MGLGTVDESMCEFYVLKIDCNSTVPRVIRAEEVPSMTAEQAVSVANLELHDGTKEQHTVHHPQVRPR